MKSLRKSIAVWLVVVCVTPSSLPEVFAASSSPKPVAMYSSVFAGKAFVPALLMFRLSIQPRHRVRLIQAAAVILMSLAGTTVLHSQDSNRRDLKATVKTQPEQPPLATTGDYSSIDNDLAAAMLLEQTHATTSIASEIDLLKEIILRYPLSSSRLTAQDLLWKRQALIGARREAVATYLDLLRKRGLKGKDMTIHNINALSSILESIYPYNIGPEAEALYTDLLAQLPSKTFNDAVSGLRVALRRSKLRRGDWVGALALSPDSRLAAAKKRLDRENRPYPVNNFGASDLAARIRSGKVSVYIHFANPDGENRTLQRELRKPAGTISPTIQKFEAALNATVQQLAGGEFSTQFQLQHVQVNLRQIDRMDNPYEEFETAGLLKADPNIQDEIRDGAIVVVVDKHIPETRRYAGDGLFMVRDELDAVSLGNLIARQLQATMFQEGLSTNQHKTTAPMNRTTQARLNLTGPQSAFVFSSIIFRFFGLFLPLSLKRRVARIKQTIKDTFSPHLSFRRAFAAAA